MSSGSLLCTRIFLIILCIAVDICAITVMATLKIRFQLAYWFVWLPLILSLMSSSVFCTSAKTSPADTTSRKVLLFILAAAWFASPSYRINMITKTKTPFMATWFCSSLACKMQSISDICGLLIGLFSLVELALAAKYSKAYPGQKPVTAIFVASSTADQNSVYIPLGTQQSHQQPVAQSYAYNHQGYDQSQPLQPQPGYGYPAATPATTNAYQPPAFQQTTTNAAPYHF
ncbi:hypothetical protein BGZ93_009601 [Podila epicladia]|nr:hypothetical protein BGZ92_008771 [Podila epicladia]KAG0098988.1 hypothetical protein BGZ93_009601 [Podila epicladia]